jgi:hypothetical protein
VDDRPKVNIAQVEDVLSCVDQNTQGLCKEMTKKIDETQLDLKAMRTSVDMRTRVSRKQ